MPIEARRLETIKIEKTENRRKITLPRNQINDRIRSFLPGGSLFVIKMLSNIDKKFESKNGSVIIGIRNTDRQL